MPARSDQVITAATACVWSSRASSEGEVLAALNHPNITTIHRLEEAPGLAY